jgi:WXG100 family type VII secretion target
MDMTSGVSGVDLAGLLKTAQGQEQALQDGMTQLNTAVSHAESLAGGWTGEASSAFQQALGNFHDNGMAVLQALQDMHNAMSNTHDVFSNTHNTTVDLAKKAGSITSQRPGLAGL